MYVSNDTVKSCVHGTNRKAWENIKKEVNCPFPYSVPPPSLPSFFSCPLFPFITSAILTSSLSNPYTILWWSRMQRCAASFSGNFGASLNSSISFLFKVEHWRIALDSSVKSCCENSHHSSSTQTFLSTVASPLLSRCHVSNLACITKDLLMLNYLAFARDKKTCEKCR